MSNIINYINGVLTMDNGSGCRWVPMKTEAGWGMGHFEIDGKSFGGDEKFMLTEDAVDWGFAIPEFTVLKNTEDEAVLRFFGQHSKILFTLDVTMKKGSGALEFDYTLDPQLPVYRRVYASVPFCAENAEFVKYPYEDSLTQSNLRSFEIETDFARAPLVIGKQGGGFICAGYYLTDDFTSGKIGYIKERSEFRLYAQFKGMAKKNDIQLARTCDNLRKVDLKREIELCKRKFRFIVSLGKTQFDCVSGYMDSCGYDWHADLIYSTENAEKDLMSLYKRAKFIEGKGYTWRISTDTGEYDTVSPHGSYSRAVLSAGQMQLALEIYRHWQLNRAEQWAHDRPFSMADFYLQRQLEQGIVLLYDVDAGDEDKAHPEESVKAALNSYAIMTCEQCVGAMHLLQLYEEVKKTEGIDNESWRDGALKTLYLVLAMVGPDGSVGRNYNFVGQYDKLGSALAELLLAFQYAYDYTGDVRFDAVRQGVENWLWSTKLSINNWADGSPDSGSWPGADELLNNDTLDMLSTMCYCCMRYEKTGEQRYIDMAKHIFAYQWSAVVPVQMKGFKHFTRGLMREQDFYCCFDPPIRIFDYAECLPYLTKITGDKRFMQFFRIILQTQMDCQEKDDPFKGFHLGLEADTDGLTPIDKFAEGKVVYIVLFASMFLKTINGPMCYAYVGGKDWGMGMDYYVNFDFSALKGLPYVLSCSSMIRDISYNPDNKTMRIWAYDKKHRAASFELVWNSSYSLENSTVFYGDKVSKASELYDAKSGVLRFDAENSEAPSKIVQLVLAQEQSE